MKTTSLCLRASLALVCAASAVAQTGYKPQKNVVPEPWILFMPEWDKSTDGGSGRIYSKPDPASKGSIAGHVDGIELGMCIAMESPAVAFMGTDPDHIRVYRAVPDVTAKGSSFKFEGLPTGKYDIVLIDRRRNLWEGLTLGEDKLATFSATSRTNLQTRVNVSDSYFNRRTIQRVGIDTSTEPVRAIVLVERQRVGGILKQSAETFNGNQRRLEVIEFIQASDEWQYSRTRHLYRLGEPSEANPPFFKPHYVSELNGIRIIDSPKDLGAIKLPQN